MSNYVMSKEQRFCEVIKDALQEMEKCPDDSIQDIWNEFFERWELPYNMELNSYIVKHKDVE